MGGPRESGRKGDENESRQPRRERCPRHRACSRGPQQHRRCGLHSNTAAVGLAGTGFGTGAASGGEGLGVGFGLAAALGFGTGLGLSAVDAALGFADAGQRAAANGLATGFAGVGGSVSAFAGRGAALTTALSAAGFLVADSCAEVRASGTVSHSPVFLRRLRAEEALACIITFRRLTLQWVCLTGTHQ